MMVKASNFAKMQFKITLICGPNRITTIDKKSVAKNAHIGKYTSRNVQKRAVWK